MSPAAASRDRILSYITSTNNNNNNNNTGLSDIPGSVLDQSEVLKHLLSTNSNSHVNNNNNSSSSRAVNGTSSTTTSGAASDSSSLLSHVNQNSFLKSSLSIGIGDHHLHDFSSKTCAAGDDTGGSGDGGVSKLTFTKSSSSGSVYSGGHVDNITPTSGYSSASTSTQFSLNNNGGNTRRTYNNNNNNQQQQQQMTVKTEDTNRYSIGGNNNNHLITSITSYGGGDDGGREIPNLPPPPAYPHWRVDSARAAGAGAGAGGGGGGAGAGGGGGGITAAGAAGGGGSETPRGRGPAAGVGRDTRRDMSLGPGMGREPSPKKSVDHHNNLYGLENDRLNMSKSQPDLSRLENNAKDRVLVVLPQPSNNSSSSGNNNNLKDVSLLSQKLSPGELPGVVDLLYNENIALRLELEIYSRKVTKLQKFEAEILKAHAAHENLVQICNRREQLEKLARTKLQNQVQTLTKVNLDLKEEMDSVVRREHGGNTRTSSDTEVRCGACNINPFRADVDYSLY